MGFKRFASWPSFNGVKVVLDNDARLEAAVPIEVEPDKTWRVIQNAQASASIPIRVGGTVILDGILVMR